VKILDLRLTAFGHFTDASLDLSAGTEGMHIVYGANEAGKSTALRALKSFFYRIPARSDDNFLHQYTKMEIGATLRKSDGSVLHATRRKGNKNTLLGEDGQDVEEALRNQFLGGLDEDLFAQQFGIDYDALVRGGAELLEGGGAVGDSLFSAGLGGGGVQEVLESLDQEMRGIFLPTGSKPIINATIAEHRDAKRRIRETELRSSDWKQHEDQLAQAKEELSKVSVQLADLDRERSRLERYQHAIPLIARHRSALESLEQLRDAVVLPDGFAEERRSLVQERGASGRDIEEAQADLGAINAEVETLSIPAGLLDNADIVRALHLRLGEHQKATTDAIGLRASHTTAVSAGSAILKEIRAELTWDDADTLRLPESQRVRVRDLGAARQSLYDRREAAEQKLTELRNDLSRLRSQLERSETPQDVQGLAAAIAEAERGGDLDGDLVDAVSTVRTTRQDLDVRAKSLPLWDGSIEALETLAVPSVDTVDRFLDEANALDTRAQTLADAEASLNDDIADHSRELNALQLEGAVPTEEDLRLARERRDTGWELIRRAWVDGDSDQRGMDEYASGSTVHGAYESGVREADDTADRLRREADRVAQQATYRASLLKAREELDECKQEQDALEQQRADWASLWNDAWRPVDIRPLSPREMRGWLQRLAEIVQVAAELRRQQQIASTLSERMKDHADRLGRLLQALGEAPPREDESLAATLARGRVLRDALQDKIDERERLEEDIPRIATDVENAQQALDRAEEAITAWRADWVDAIRVLGLGDNAMPAEANAVLTRIETLTKHIDDAASYAGRLNGIDRDAEQFRRDVRALVETVAPEMLDTAPDQCVAQLDSRLDAAEKDAATLRQLEERRKGAQKRIADAERSLQRGATRLRAMCDEANCESEEGLADAETRSATKRELQDRFEGIESQLLDHAAGGTLEALLREAENVDPDTLASQLRDLTQEAETLRHRQGEIHQDIGREETELRAMDGSSEAAAAAEDAAQLLARIGERAERYARLKVASMVLRREIDRYREENQAPILTVASGIFQRLTCGSFDALTTDYSDSDEPVLIGVRPTGDHVRVEGMSDGSRDQLYLALRLASLERYLDANEPMPFIVDDILIKFDDERGRAALEALHELSRRTQVIFFTHHDHLTRIAQEALNGGDMTLHRLGS
jgi:uncharacterized protein YhaN